MARNQRQLTTGHFRVRTLAKNSTPLFRFIRSSSTRVKTRTLETLIRPDFRRTHERAANRQETCNHISINGGNSIRSIERMTGVHRDTIMRPLVRTGQYCATILDETIRGVPCDRLEFDEIWTYLFKETREPKSSFVFALRLV